MAMQIPVLIEPTSENTFRATSGDPFGLEVEATTRDEAVRELRNLLERRLEAGAELVEIDIQASHHPMAAFAGSLKDEPLLEAWRKAREEYRSAREGELL
jgi:hypothetical protein